LLGMGQEQGFFVANAQRGGVQLTKDERSDNGHNPEPVNESETVTFRI